MKKPWLDLTREEANVLYAQVMGDNDVDSMRKLCQHDLFFLLTVAFRRQDANRDWLYDRCREVERNPDGYLDLWAREHYKSTIITYALTIQDILRDPEITVGIFSHTRPIAKAFLKQIKTELETNTFLQGLFPDVLYVNPERESTSWSLDNGITVKRKTNPKENTVEAWGLVDGQPTSKHYRLLVYDDVVTRESVTTPDMMVKVSDAWALSLNLGAADGAVRYIGTRYHFGDCYKTMLERSAATPRIRPATVNGTVDGEPVFLSAEALDEKRRLMGPYVFSCQMLQNPIADEAQGFKEEWLSFYDVKPDYRGWHLYLLVDPASEKKKHNDFTAMWVVGLAPDQNYYILDGIRDRLNLTERANKVFEFARRYPLKKVGYEKYGQMADHEHIRFRQSQDNFRFPIVELGGSMPKPDRIRRLIPLFENGRVWMPRRLLFRSAEGKTHDLIRELVDEEYKAFPVSVHDDLLDCLARIVEDDLGANFPDLFNMRIGRDLNYRGEVRNITNHEYAVL